MVHHFGVVVALVALGLLIDAGMEEKDPESKFWACMAVEFYCYPPLEVWAVDSYVNCFLDPFCSANA